MPGVSQRQFDDEWRRWIAENFSLGGSRESILSTLVRAGFSVEDASDEVGRAESSPYLLGSRRLLNRLKKREWVLEIQRRLNRLRPSDGSVEVIHRPSREVFLRDYYAKNCPVVITGAMDKWPAMTKWSPSWLKECLGERVVEVQMGRAGNPRYEVESNRHRKMMRFGDYVDVVTSCGKSNDCYITANNSSRNFAALRELWDDIGPLTEYLDPASDRKGFFWFGPAGTITPFHHDLTNNFMAQVMGRKRILLIPAWDIPFVYNDFHCFTSVDGGNIDLKRFPLLAQAQIVEVVLEPGEVLFLPVGWWHYVEGLDITITMSFTNFRWDNDFHTSYTTRYEV